MTSMKHQPPAHPKPRRPVNTGLRSAGLASIVWDFVGAVCVFALALAFLFIGSVPFGGH